MNFIKNIFKKFRTMDKEYLVFFVVIIFLGLIIRSTAVVSQQLPEEIVLSTLYPSPMGVFNILGSMVYRDYDNPQNRYVDAMGRSVLFSLRVENRLLTSKISGPPYDDANPEASSALADFQTGNARFRTIYATRFYQIQNGPVGLNGRRGSGKYVYDIAEGVYAKDCEAGDVVLISDNDQTDVMKSLNSFSNKVAGVISSEPKIYMGSNKHKVPLALAGVVKCKASNENGIIKRGDLLVTSSLPGYAMRAMPQEVSPGMVIGKAMEPLNEKTGEILILVNRQ